MEIKTILISQFPLPYSKIGSWTNMYKQYIYSKNHQIDIIICKKPKKKFKSFNYNFVSGSSKYKIINFLYKKKKHEYIKALNRSIISDKKYIIQIVDDFNLLYEVDEFLRTKFNRDNFYIQFFYHGFAPVNIKKGVIVNEFIVLTKNSLNSHLSRNLISINKYSILNNGINTNLFFKLNNERRDKLRIQKNIDNKIIFIWCSRDVPKKGLNLILESWSNIYKEELEIELWIIGSKRKIEIEGTRNFGVVLNNKLPEYFQISDCYLFPTLCLEGFGLTLIEALNCGNHCIASALGGVPNVLKNGEYGELIYEPKEVKNWENAILDYIKNKKEKKIVSKKFYPIENWIKDMNSIVFNAKKTLLKI